MYQMQYRVEVPLTTIADGTGMAIICPISAINPSGIGTPMNRMPFVTIPAGSTTTPFATAPTYSAAGPFNSQLSNMVTYAVDSCSVDFI